MDLKNKFSNYQTEFDPAAWEDFRLLREQKDRKPKGFIWFFLGFVFALSIIGFTYLYNNKNTFYTKKETTTHISSKNPVKITDAHTNNISDTKSVSTEITTTTFSNEEYNNKPKARNNLSIIEDNPTLPSIHLNVTQASSSNTNTSFQKLTNKNFVQTSSPAFDNQAITKKPQEDNLIKQNTNSTLVNEANASDLKGIHLNSLTTKAKYAYDLIDYLNPTYNPTPIIKPVKVKKNTLKLGAGYADGFINGFAIENPVHKKGFALQFDYYRSWNKIIATGLSLGYIKAVDANNPLLEMKGLEEIKFLHVNLYLFLVNERRHKLYGKVGAGPTNTYRILGTFYEEDNLVERRTQVNQLTNIGFSVEGAYEFQLTESLILGTNFSIISHNDGGWYTNLSLGYRF